MKMIWSRAPYGARGLKLDVLAGAGGQRGQSRPVWGAWIEISALQAPKSAADVAPRMGRVD